VAPWIDWGQVLCGWLKILRVNSKFSGQFFHGICRILLQTQRQMIPNFAFTFSLC
jgi:hypothetical protein